jgi:hypothetical protein
MNEGPFRDDSNPYKAEIKALKEDLRVLANLSRAYHRMIRVFRRPITAILSFLLLGAMFMHLSISFRQERMHAEDIELREQVLQLTQERDELQMQLMVVSLRERVSAHDLDQELDECVSDLAAEEEMFGTLVEGLDEYCSLDGESQIDFLETIATR